MITCQFTDTRDMRFGEIVLVKDSEVDVYNTSGLNDCPPEIWNALDAEKLKSQLGARAVGLNGPKFMTYDSMTLAVGDKRSFGGIEARFVARLGVDKAHRNEPYKVYTSKRTHRMVYAKGKPVFELIDPDGNSYVLQAHDVAHPMERLPKLGEQLKLPTGWKYRTRIPTEDLVLDLRSDHAVHMVPDEFNQYYTRIESPQ